MDNDGRFLQVDPDSKSSGGDLFDNIEIDKKGTGCFVKTSHKASEPDHDEHNDLSQPTLECHEVLHPDFENSILENQSPTKLYKCKICQKGFSSMTYMHSHMKNNHGKESNVSCKECGKYFRSEIGLKSHHRLMHDINIYFQCKTCYLKLSSPLELRVHQTKFHGRQDKKFACETCGKRYFTDSYLKSHMITAHRWKEFSEIVPVMYNCDVCDLTFKTKGSFTTHYNLKHRETKTRYFSCALCPKNFLSSKTLRDHERTIHSSFSEIITCKMCKVVLTSKWNYTAHLKTQSMCCCAMLCGYCNKEFNSRCNYYSHHNEAHLTKKPILKCPKCNFAVTDFPLLRFQKMSKQKTTNPTPSVPTSKNLSTSACQLSDTNIVIIKQEDHLQFNNEEIETYGESAEDSNSTTEEATVETNLLCMEIKVEPDFVF